MSNDILEGRSEQIRGSTQKRQRKLTDSEIEGVWGKRDQFLRALQAEYGYPRANAGEEIDQKHMRAGVTLGEHENARVH